MCIWSKERGVGIVKKKKKNKHKKQTLHGVTCAKAHDAKPRFNL